MIEWILSNVETVTEEEEEEEVSITMLGLMNHNSYTFDKIATCENFVMSFFFKHKGQPSRTRTVNGYKGSSKVTQIQNSTMLEKA